MSYAKRSYLWMTLDPVHIGTGGYRLGRVDLSIAREPGTNLPKIPGTSLSGAARSYAAMENGDLRCAGQGDHCQDKKCPVCYTFGSLTVGEGKDQKAYAGTINIFDAHLLFFPVHSMAGPVWVTCFERLELARLKPNFGEEPAGDKIVLSAGIDAPKHRLNLGWLLLEAVKQPLELKGDLLDGEAWNAIADRVVLVSNKLFGQIVNANLEVRTSVSINPLTGAAEEGALFTYEAIPRSAFLVSDVVKDDFRQHPQDDPEGWPDPLHIADGGLKMIEWLGVGGMGTRGFGRMRVINTVDEKGGSNA
jgi:CRISPR-associated protein Cmr4